MKDRLLALMKAESLSPSQFADELSIQRSAVSHLVSGRNLPSYDVLVKILKRFPDVNPEWLLLGKGEMYRKPHTGTLFEQPLLSPETAADTVKTEGIREIRSSDPEKYGSSVPDAGKNTNRVKEILLLFADNTYQRFVPQQDKGQ